MFQGVRPNICRCYEGVMMEKSVPLFIQDVIELLTNIKLKHGNLPVYIEHGMANYRLLQDDQFGIHLESPGNYPETSVSFSVET